jgi:glycosyltransferase involved in cell wall biosynthesis
MQKAAASAEGGPPMAPVRVLHVVGGLSLAGGITSFVFKLARQPVPKLEQRIWLHRGFVAPEPDLPVVRQGRATKVVGSLPKDLGSGLVDAWPLARWSRGQPRLVLCAHSRVGIIAACLAHWRTGVPLVIFFHFLGNRARLYQWLVRATGATPAFNSRKTCLHYQFDPAQAIIVNPPIAWPLRPPPPRAPARRRFVAAGLFVRNKNLDILLQAFARLPAPETELHLYGLAEQPADPQCQDELVAASQRLPRVHLHPYDARWAAELAPADIFVHVGRPESFGIVILEAFAAGAGLVVLPDTFLEDFPEPQRTEGIDRVRQVAVPELVEAMAASLTRRRPPAGWWELRQELAPRFTFEHSAHRLFAAFYKLGSSG